MIYTLPIIAIVAILLVLWRTRKPRAGPGRSASMIDFRYRPSAESKFKAGLGLPDGGTDATRSTRGTE